LRPVAGSERTGELRFSGPRVRIGRSRDNDLVLPDRSSPSSSGHHAEAVLDGGLWSIVDAGSANGTRVNGVQVKRQILKTGDRVAFGDEQFAVSIGTVDRRPLVAAGVAVAALVVVAAWLLWRTTPQTFETVAAAAAPSVYMIAIEGDGQRAMIGSGFAVTGDGWLATNAHIADVLLTRQALPPYRSDAKAIAVQGDSFAVHSIARVISHPRWKADSLAHDVGLVKLEGTKTSPLALADAAMLQSLARGTPIAAFGFPAVSTDASHPRGRLSVDIIGDIRGDYLEVGLGISPGMSGSPVLDRRGAVVAVVVGGDFVEMPDGTARPSGSSANWALSASEVRGLLDSAR
jgi:hypothetical protein